MKITLIARGVGGYVIATKEVPTSKYSLRVLRRFRDRVFRNYGSTPSVEVIR